MSEAARNNRGKLTVFLGAAAGVGKTFTMLETARQRVAEGMDVVVGWVETHGRPDTEKLLAGLQRIAPRTIVSQGRLQIELDAATIENRKPELVLIDDLAHTNAAGSCHLRRHQDVEDLLDCYLDGELASGLVSRFEGHLHRCESCQELVEDCQTVIRLARELDREPIPADVSQRLRSALSEELGEVLVRQRPVLSVVKGS